MHQHRAFLPGSVLQLSPRHPSATSPQPQPEATAQRKIARMAALLRPPTPRRIESRQNPRLKELRAALAHGGRTPSGLLAIEGEHLLEEAARSALRVTTLFLREGTPLPSTVSADEVLLLPAAVFASLSATETPQGIAALVETPTHDSAAIFASRTPLVLLLAGLQDPGNVGTLLRSAEAFAASGALLLPGTASPWNPKALRASAGSAFRMPLLFATEDEAIALLRRHQVTTFAAVAQGGIAPSAAALDGPTALLIGNEGAGLPPSLVAAADQRITLPMPGAVESLNAAIAGSLLLYECARQRTSHAAKAADTLALAGRAR